VVNFVVMFEQLDIFGGEPTRPKESPKKKYALVPPVKVVEEAQTPIEAPSTSADIQEQAIEAQETAELAAPIAEDVHEIIAIHQDFSIDNQYEKDKSGGRHAINTFDADAAVVNIPEDELLHSKQYYPIGEVASMFNVNISLIRFWEKEFDILKPRKNKKGDRLFRPEDIKNLKLIYFLLREKKYTIDGARTFIKKGKKMEGKFEAIDSLKNIRAMLIELKASLS
jgi:DNA-binding transcriptional MerR regulator